MRARITRGLAVAAGLAMVAGSGLLAAPAAGAATNGTLNLTPGSGTGATAFSVVTSAGCSDASATHFQVTMSGTGLAEPINLNGVQPLSAIPASGTQTTPMTITVSKIFDVVKADNGGQLPAGVYDVKVICRAQMSIAPISTFTGKVTIRATSGGGIGFENGNVAPQAIKNVNKPKVTGNLKAGNTLKVSTGSWTPSPDSYRYSWKIGKKVVSTKATYKTTAKDRRKTVSVTVSALKAGYTTANATVSVRIR